MKNIEKGITLDDYIDRWLADMNIGEKEKPRILLIDLFKDFVCWCYARGYDTKEITVQRLSSALITRGYEKVQSYKGMYFIMR